MRALPPKPAGFGCLSPPVLHDCLPCPLTSRQDRGRWVVTTSIEDAVKNAVAKRRRRRRNLRWLEVVETRCHLGADAIAHGQVTVRIGATAE
jgi:flavin-binding protein dodecin